MKQVCLSGVCTCNLVASASLAGFRFFAGREGGRCSSTVAVSVVKRAAKLAYTFLQILAVVEHRLFVIAEDAEVLPRLGRKETGPATSILDSHSG